MAKRQILRGHRKTYISGCDNECDELTKKYHAATSEQEMLEPRVPTKASTIAMHFVKMAAILQYIATSLVKSTWQGASADLDLYSAFTIDEMQRTLRSFKSSKAPRPDSIHPECLMLSKRITELAVFVHDQLPAARQYYNDLVSCKYYCHPQTGQNPDGAASCRPIIILLVGNFSND